jgi:hypothetical protein
MKSETVDNIITIVGGAYFQPITDLVACLQTLSTEASRDEVHVSPRENGYAAAICLLSVVALESFLMRVRYFKHGEPTPGPLKIFRCLYPAYPRPDDIAEAFVVRDLLAHNHLWEVKYKWEEEDNATQLLGALYALDSLGREDPKYTEHVDSADRRTKGLRLHILPNRVDRRDAATILKVVWEALEFMEADDRTACPVSPGFVKFGKETVRFRDLIKRFYEWVCASWAMLREKTSTSSTGMRRENLSDCQS